MNCPVHELFDVPTEAVGLDAILPLMKRFGNETYPWVDYQKGECCRMVLAVPKEIRDLCEHHTGYGELPHGAMRFAEWKLRVSEFLAGFVAGFDAHERRSQ